MPTESALGGRQCKGRAASAGDTQATGSGAMGFALLSQESESAVPPVWADITCL